MIKKNFKIHSKECVHFIGIGGISISGIAIILLNKGYKVSGSDLVSNNITKNLSQLGATIYCSHQEKNVYKSDLVVVSSAIPKNNIEIITAKKMKIPIISRGKMLSQIMKFYYGIVVIGTHGKTTTTAIIGEIYKNSGLDPTIINSGFLKKINTHVHIGKSFFLITEADESDGSFLYLKPKKVIVTNIENDHLNFYNGDFNNLKNTFIKFLKNLPYDSQIFMCIDDIVIRKLFPFLNKNPFITTYGFSEDADIKIIDYHQKKMKSYFSLTSINKPIKKIKLNIPGLHNALNATAAVTASHEIKDKYIIKTLKNFLGVKRRFDFLGKIFIKNINKQFSKYAILLEDYGHHPTEINYTIETIKIGWPKKNLIMIFQPHRYTRTKDLYKDFIKILLKVNTLLILNINAAGEKPISGVNSKNLCNDIKKFGITNSIFISNKNFLLKKLIPFLLGNDLILLQGANNLKKIILELIKKTKELKFIKPKRRKMF